MSRASRGGAARPPATVACQHCGQKVSVNKGAMAQHLAVCRKAPRPPITYTYCEAAMLARDYTDHWAVCLGSEAAEESSPLSARERLAQLRAEHEARKAQ